MGVAIGSLAAAPRLLADQEPINIDYTVADSCPSSQEFMADVRLRTALANQHDGRDTRQFVVTVTRGTDRQFLGTLRIVSPGTFSSVPREVKDASCLEVVRTLALVMALAIDPQALTGPSTIGTDQSSSSGMLSQAGSPPVAPPPSVNPAPPATSSHAPWREYRDGEDALSPAPEARPQGVDWQWSSGAQGLALFHVTPIAAIGGGVFGEVQPKGRWIIWPDFRVAAAYAQTAGSWTGVHDSGVRAKSWWLLARGEACPGRFGTPHSELTLRFCALFDAGVFTNTGVDLVHSQTTTREWLAVGPAIRLTIRLSSVLFTDFEPALVIPITRWNFTYKESSTGADHTLDKIRSIGESFSWSVGYGFR